MPLHYTSDSHGQQEEQDDKTYITYIARWLVLAAFCLLNGANALLWVTFSPISDLSEQYMECGTTAVNSLSTIFLFLFPAGTVLEVYIYKEYGLRNTLLLGGILSTLGSGLRALVAANRRSISSSTLYGVTLVGQAFAAIAQPLLVNVPAAISNSWFAVNERDAATTVGSMFSAVGNAVGSLLPVLFVTKDANNGSIHGMTSLMNTECLICLVSLLIAAVVITDAPPSPPSKSSSPTLQASSSAQAALSWKALKDVNTLLKDRDFCVLCLSFSISLGVFNALVALVNQIVQPFGYDNVDAGYCGASLILFGLFGAALNSILMGMTKDYLNIVRSGFLLCLFSIITLFLLLRHNNITCLLFGFSLVGFFFLPLLPCTFELCADTTFPISSDISVGLLLVGGNLLGIPITFVLQDLIQLGSVYAAVLCCTLVGVSSFFLVVINPVYKRRLHESSSSSSPLALLSSPLLSTTTDDLTRVQS